jgi:hypothetical protein
MKWGLIYRAAVAGTPPDWLLGCVFVHKQTVVMAEMTAEESAALLAEFLSIRKGERVAESAALQARLSRTPGDDADARCLEEGAFNPSVLEALQLRFAHEKLPTQLWDDWLRGAAGSMTFSTPLPPPSLPPLPNVLELAEVLTALADSVSGGGDGGAVGEGEGGGAPGASAASAEPNGAGSPDRAAAASPAKSAPSAGSPERNFAGRPSGSPGPAPFEKGLGDAFLGLFAGGG